MSDERILRDLLIAWEEQQVRLVELIARYAEDAYNSGATGAVEATRYLERKLATTQALVRDAEKALASPDPKAVQDLMEGAWRRGIDWADADLEAAGAAMSGQTVAAVPQVNATPPRVLLALTEEANRAVQGTRLPILRATRDAYREVIYSASREMATGSTTLQQAVGRAVDEMARRGVRGFTDSLGRQWLPETYAEMSIRTAYTRAANAGRVQRYQDRGHNLVIVSDVFGECPRCRPWELKVLQITPGPVPEGVSVAGTLGQAQAAGLQHANCRHQVNVYIPGLTKPRPRMRDQGQYEQIQAHRRQRLRVRQERRRLAAAKAANNAGGVAAAQVRLRQALEDYTPPPLNLFPEQP